MTPCPVEAPMLFSSSSSTGLRFSSRPKTPAPQPLPSSQLVHPLIPPSRTRARPSTTPTILPCCSIIPKPQDSGRSDFDTVTDHFYGNGGHVTHNGDQHVT